MDSWIAILPAQSGQGFGLRWFGLGFFACLFWFCLVSLVFGFFLSLLRFSNFVLAVLLHLHNCVPFVSVSMIRDGRNSNKVYSDVPFFPVALCSALTSFAIKALQLWLGEQKSQLPSSHAQGVVGKEELRE